MSSHAHLTENDPTFTAKKRSTGDIIRRVSAYLWPYKGLALATIAKIFACPGNCAVVEDPTYFLAGKIFADAGIRCVRVGVDCDGLQVASDTLNLFPSSTVGT